MKKIAICGSIKFSKEMVKVKSELKSIGIEAILPLNIEEISKDEKLLERSENANRKAANNSIYVHYLEIDKSDAILVLNYDKNGIANYIGANTFLEMGFAHVLDKPIYILNKLPDMDYIKDELKAFRPIVLNGNLAALSHLFL